jgi:hypothetical protein
MSFENLVLGFELDPFLLGGNPTFRTFVFKDENPLGGTVKLRKLEAPNDAMRIIHGRLIQYLRSLEIEMPYATACRLGDSPRKNLERHKGNRYFFVLDLKNAYRQVDQRKLARILCAADPALKGSEEEVSAFLGQYCVSKFGGLPMGASASPDLFNLYCAVLLDVPLGKLCAEYGWVYTRYLDDLTISCTSDPPTRRVGRPAIRAIVEEAGFKVNHKKARLRDLAFGPIFLNGIGLEHGGRIFVPQWYVTHVRGLLLWGLQGDFTLRPKIDGAMGVFLSIIDRHNPTATERKVIGLHQRFRWLMRRSSKMKKRRGLAPPRLVIRRSSKMKQH